MPAVKQLSMKELSESNLIGSLSVPQYIASHQINSPIVRTEYCELEDIGLVSYRSLYTEIRVGKQVVPIVSHIIPEMSGPLMLGNNYKDSHAEDPDTPRKVNTMKHKKVFFFKEKKNARPNLTVKVLKRMHLDMKHGSHADMSAERNRLGGSKKNIDSRISIAIQEFIACTQGKFRETNCCLTKTFLYSTEG